MAVSNSGIEIKELPAVSSLYVYLHTHWDREWYLPFNHYRALLLERFRKTFAALESGELTNFYFDGQAIVLDDLIEIDKGFAPRIKNLMKKGLLSAGPWYVLPDQSLIGGESVIRNLKLGIATVRQFGEPTMTGYNPDTFCHVQDLPRMLSGCGIDTAMVLRGVPEIGDNNTFWWESPDGSKILVYWLRKGLSHTTFHNTDDVNVMMKELSSWWPPPGDNSRLMLFSAGKDHTPAPGNFKGKLKELNKVLPLGHEVVAVSMEEFLGNLKRWAKDKKLPELSGDLRDNTNTAVSEWFPAYVLDGVSSTRLYLKRANALTEHRLVRIAEPLFAMLQTMGAMPYPAHELDYLWKLLIQNHPHDSICGCSVDPVHQEMMTRTQQINSFLDGLDDIILNHLNKWDGQLHSGGMTTSGTCGALPVIGGPQANDPESGNDRLLIFNTSCYATAAPVKMTWYVEADKAEIKPAENVQIDSNELMPHYLFYGGDNIYYKPIRRVEGWVYPLSKVPGMGYAQQQWHGGESFAANDSGLVRYSAEYRTSARVTNKHNGGHPDESQPGEAAAATTPNAQLIEDNTYWRISNGSIEAGVDKEGNLVVVTQQQNSDKTRQIVSGHNFYDVGDGGDSYNFDPLDGDVPLKAKLVEVKPGAPGPLVSSLILSYSLDIPAGLDHESNTPAPYEKRRRCKTMLKHVIETEISLRKNVPILFFKTTWENHSGDHRLEVRFNTEQSATQSIAECHFSTAKRFPVTSKTKLPVEVGKEAPPSGYFCQRFFMASDQIFFNRGLPEYRVEDGYAAITLLRSVSYLSRGRLRTRGGGAGPWEPTPQANCLGTNCCEYGVAFIENAGGENSDSAVDTSSQDQQIASAYQLTDLFEGRLVPLHCGKFIGNNHQSLIEISNPALYVTATYMEKESIILRILNTSHNTQQTKVSLAFPISKIGKVNLLGEDFQSTAFQKEPSNPSKSSKDASSKTSFELKLGKNELTTLRID